MNRQERRALARDKGKRQEGPPPAVAEAIRRHQMGDLKGAEAAYVAELARNPTQPETLHFLGVLRYQQQRLDEGIELVRRSLSRKPGYFEAWNNLGNMYKETGRLEEAEDAYKKALERESNRAGTWNNLGVVLRTRGRAQDAVVALRQAVKYAPTMTDAHVNLGNALRQCGLMDDAITSFRRALEINPTHIRAHKLLGPALYLARRREEAEAAFRAWQRVDPGNPIASHMLAAFSGQDVPARASDDFLRTTFDEFADDFDENLVQSLDYRAPELLAVALREAVGPQEPVRDILDAGCGTGLSGVPLKPFARTLAGVDLSRRMLAKAQARAIYDALYEDEITRFLASHAGAYDVIVSADTLIYFGEIGPFAMRAFGALRSDGWLVFSVERADDVDTYRLNPHGRYSHAKDYLATTLDAAGFVDTRIEPGVLRTEAGQAVDGWVVRGRKP